MNSQSVEINFRNRIWKVFETPDKCWNPPYWEQVRDGLWEPQTYDIFDRFLTPEMTYIDLGAWIGPTIMYAATMVNRSLAIEPDPVAFSILEQHIKENNLIVELHNHAITNYTGTLTLGSNSLGFSTTRVNPSGGGRQPAWNETFTVNCSTLADFVSSNKINNPLFIKMDIEGSEENVLTDFEFFEKYKPILYVSLHPFWWKNEISWETLKKVSSFYKTVYNGSMNKIDIDHTTENEVLFID